MYGQQYIVRLALHTHAHARTLILIVCYQWYKEGGGGGVTAVKWVYRGTLS